MWSLISESWLIILPFHSQSSRRTVKNSGHSPVSHTEIKALLQTESALKSDAAFGFYNNKKKNNESTKTWAEPVTLPLTIRWWRCTATGQIGPTSWRCLRVTSSWCCPNTRRRGGSGGCRAASGATSPPPAWWSWARLVGSPPEWAQQHCSITALLQLPGCHNSKRCPLCYSQRSLMTNWNYTFLRAHCSELLFFIFSQGSMRKTWSLKVPETLMGIKTHLFPRLLVFAVKLNAWKMSCELEYFMSLPFKQ